MNYHKHLVFSKAKIANDWAYKVKKRTCTMLTKLNGDLDFFIRDNNNVFSKEDYIPFNLKNIDKRYAVLFKEILTLFEVGGIWKEIISPETNTESIITIRLFGNDDDIKMAKRVITYYHRGLENYRDNIISEARRQKINRRRRKANSTPINSKALGNQKLEMKIWELIQVFQGGGPNLLSFKHFSKKERVYNWIAATEKLDYRKYKSLNPPVRLALANKGEIQLNRIL